MRGDLDETLARLARREEALRRRGADLGDEPGREPAAPAVPVETPALRSRPGGDAGPNPADALPRRMGSVPALPAAPALAYPAGAAAGRDPVDEVSEAVARVVAAHPGMTVALRVEHDGQSYPLRVGWSNGRVTVGAEAATVPPPVWPLSVKAGPAWTSDDDRLKADPAARLAELIRRDPSLLDGTDPTR
ncbi:MULTISPECIES: hypothetical protein [unclassified Micromonospora]|uniref:hypothetical protein n=1 Tax=unclassified Micromonospora TaxID=2617518 RepID=UPI00363E4EE2